MRNAAGENVVIARVSGYHMVPVFRDGQEHPAATPCAGGPPEKLMDCRAGLRADAFVLTGAVRSTHSGRDRLAVARFIR
jgi:hypothetical protein